MGHSDDDKDGREGKSPLEETIAFPQSRVRPPGSRDSYTDLGTSVMTEKLGMPKEQTTGHWCSQCKGIWFGYLLEVECPVCGGRDG